MNLNFDPTVVALLAILIGVVYRVWDSIQRSIKTGFKDAEDKRNAMHAENRAALSSVEAEKKEAHSVLHGRLDKHRGRLDELRKDVDEHGYRLKAVEDDVKELKNTDD